MDKEHFSKEKIRRKFETQRRQFSVGVFIGLVLVIVTLVLQCVAFFTPHWKDISTNSATLYVDGVDALIRTEVLHYFNSIHRSRRHTYGLFHRCEYFETNNSSLNERKRCTKNYLPSYSEEHFNECHSLPYYRFCIKENEKNFDIAQDYLRAAFDVSTSLQKTPPSSPTPTSSSSLCDCQYPTYVIACQIIGVFAMICLVSWALIFLLFLFVHDTHYRLKLKCFGILFGISASVLMLAVLLLASQHSTYESIEYLIAIERHYKITQIYKLAQDTKSAIERFLKTIDIAVGYSAILAWIAFALSIIDLIFFISTCKISHGTRDDDPPSNQPIDVITPLKFEPHQPVMEEPIDSSTPVHSRPSIVPKFVEDEV